MSMSPSGSFMPSSGCRRSASQAPPVYRPIIAVAGAMCGFSSAASLGSRDSASGSFVTEVLFENDLGGVRIELLAARKGCRLAAAVGGPHAALDFRGAVAFVHQLHRQAETAVQLPREALGAARHLVRRAVFAKRSPYHQQRRFPLLHELFDRREAARLGVRHDTLQRMCGADFRLAHCDT